MTQVRVVIFVLLSLASSLCCAQIDKVTITAGTPEDNELTTIGNEADAQKRISLYEEFLKKYASNAMAVTYAKWQLSQAYQAVGDLQKAIETGDKALATSPRNVEILTSQVTIAQQLKDNARIFKYALQGGDAYDSLEKQTKPADVTDEQFKSSIANDQGANKSAYEFFQSAAFNVVAAETDANTKLEDIDKFTATFPKSGMDEQLNSFALMSLSQLKDNQRLIAYSEKALTKQPDNLAALLVLANSYVESPATAAKAIGYAQRALVAAKADDPNADKPKKISAGVAHCVLGHAYANQGKTLPSVAELKLATALLKGQDDGQYAVAAYFLGWDYAKLQRYTEARAVLTDVVSIGGPTQAPAKDLLVKVNAARAAGK
jgi:tetratricopeptide (TPR) repeat protein